jgi:hypothetical protein
MNQRIRLTKEAPMAEPTEECMVCGTRVRVVGNTTKHYEPIPEPISVKQALDTLLAANWTPSVFSEAYNRAAQAGR